jgi:hypothetical protein
VVFSVAAISLLFVRMAPGDKVSGAAPSAIRAEPALTTQPGEAPSTEAPSSFSTRPVSAQSTPNRGTPILPSEYQVQPGQHFAEIRVHRPANAGRDAALTWWTEPDSAKPGVDYVSQGKVSQSFPRGQDSMSVFVKLLPQAKRSEPEVFYIAAAERGGTRTGAITHTAVRLPSSQASF